MPKEQRSREEWRKWFSKHYVLKSSTERPPKLSNNEDMECERSGSKVFLDNVRKQLAEMKDELNYTKSQLNEYDIKKWNEHTNATNICAYLSKECKKKLNAELCTKAWLKFCTILNSCEFFQDISADRTMTSVHLCEAPGAFVTCLSHHLATKFQHIKWNWVATTLNPYYDGNPIGLMIDDDRFMKATLSNWKFGDDFTGNLMNERNLEDLRNECKKYENVTLVTADGSIDCFEDPSMQECNVSPLLYWEIITAINIMSTNASFIIKVFTILEEFTISLIYLLWQAFSEVNFIKPGPSKPGNSEVYIVCKGFHGLYELGQMFFDLAMKGAKTGDYSTPLIPMECMQGEFLAKIVECEEFFIRHQMLAINSNIDSFGHMTKSQRYKANMLKVQMCQEFIEHFDLKPLSVNDHLCRKYGKQVSINNYTKEHSHNFSAGNFYERAEKKNASWIERIDFIEPADGARESKMLWFSNADGQVDVKDVIGWNPVLGKKYEVSKNTLFYSNFNMNTLFQARASNDLSRKPENSVQQFNGNNDTTLFSELEVLLGQPSFGKIMVLQSSGEKHSVLIGNYQRKALQHAVTDFILESARYPCSKGTISSCDANYQASEADETNCLLSELKFSGLRETCENMDEPCNRELNILKCCLQILEEDRWEARDCGDTLIGLFYEGDSSKGNETSKLALLVNLCMVLRRLQVGGTLVCEVGDFFTNASAGLFYLFSLIFKRIGIFKGTAEAHRPMRALICEGLQEGSSFLIQYVKKLLVTEVQVILGQYANKEIIHVLPIQYILHDGLVEYLRSINDSHTKIQLRELKRIHSAKLKP